jgi:hypothetical protein
MSAPRNTPRSVDAPIDGQEQEADWLVAKDRNQLSSFAKSLNKGLKFEDVDDDLKSWWISRY